MPWTPSSFADKHNHGLTKVQAKKAAAIANSVLEKTGSEESAIRIANAEAKKYPRYRSGGREKK